MSEYPKNLMYTKDHEWVKFEGKTAVIGITDFAQSQLGDIVFIELPEIGREVAQGQGLAVVESVKAVSDIYSPVNGVVVKVNGAVEDSPELVNEDAYGDGWIAVVELADNEENELLDCEAYARLVEEEGGH